MRLHSLIQETKTVRVSNAVAAGTSDVNLTSVDVSGFNSVLLQVHLGAIVTGGVQSVKLQESDDNSTFSDLEGTSITVADTDDNGVVQAEVLGPLKRYIRGVVKRATQNTTIDSAVMILANPLAIPTTQTTIGNEISVTPVAGTA